MSQDLENKASVDIRSFIIEVCPICETAIDSGADNHFWKGRTKVPAALGAARYMTIYYDKCETCGMVFRNSYPEDVWIDRYYTDLYRHEDVEPSVKELQTERRRAREQVGFIKATQNWGQSEFRMRGAPRTHIDIGSSTGSLGNLLCAYGTEISIGVEPGPWRESSEKYLGRTFKTVDEIPHAFYHTIDLVTISHTFEHLVNPVAMILKIRRLLQANGRVMIAVPDLERPVQSVFAFPHLLVFSLQTLESFLNLAGFEIVARQYFSQDLTVIAKLAEPKYTIKPSSPLLREKIRLLWRLNGKESFIRQWSVSSYWVEPHRYPPKLFAKISHVLRQWYIALRGVYSLALFLRRYLFSRDKLGEY